jgi:aspartate/methionine/tyrosine aminotransferase
MRPTDFLLERFFARWEFACRYNLCASGIEGWSMHELLTLADDETARLWDRLVLGYTETAGHPLLRAEIARRYQGLTAEEIHCFAGAEEAIAMLVTAIVEAGDHVIVVRPAYQSLFELARARGAEVTELWLRPEEDYRFDPERVAAALRPSTRLCVVNFPHNPTGTTIDRATQARLVELTTRHGCWLLSDEVYRGLERTPEGSLPPGVTLGERVVSLGAMAKAYGLAGLRIGWLALRDLELRRRVASLKDYGSMCNAGPSELLALIALRAEERVLARSRAIVEGNLPALEGFMTAHAGRLAWARPSAGVTGFPRFVDEGIDVGGFCERLVQETGVLLLPGTTYGAAEPAFRIGFGRRDFAEGLERLDAFL